MASESENTITNYLPGSLVSFKNFLLCNVFVTTSKLLPAPIPIILHYSQYWLFCVIFSKLFLILFQCHWHWYWFSYYCIYVCYVLGFIKEIK